MTVQLSDGRTAVSTDGEVQMVGKRYVIVFGQKYPVLGRRAETANAGPLNDGAFTGPVVSYDPPVNQAEILPAIHGQGGVRPPSLHGFASMNNGRAEGGAAPAMTGLSQ
jgi:hypothetical protein